MAQSTTAQTLLASTVCQECNSASTYQLEQMMVALLILWIKTISPGVATDSKTLLNQAACHGCNSASSFQLLQMMVALMIDIVNNGGGGGGATCVTGGNSAPIGVPPCTYSVWIQGPGPNFGVWFADGTGWSAVAAIAQGP